MRQQPLETEEERFNTLHQLPEQLYVAKDMNPKSWFLPSTLVRGAGREPALPWPVLYLSLGREKQRD